MSSSPSISPTATRTRFGALTHAVATAGHAPSVHNTQPWRWYVRSDRLDLHLERSRLLNITDPDDRLAILSCGASLHHARVSLAVQGWCADLSRLPNPAKPDHLASVRVSRRTPVPGEPLTTAQVQAVGKRHSDRPSLTGRSVPPERLDAIVAAVAAEGASLYVLGPDQVLDLAAAAGQAQRAKAGDLAWQAEMDYWTVGIRLAEIGVAEATLPPHAGTAALGHDPLRRSDPVGCGRPDRYSNFGILHGRGDQRIDWLRAGEALSAGWLTATEIGLSLLPLSATVKMIGARKAMRVLLASMRFPYLVVRLATDGATDGSNRGVATSAT